LGFATYYVYRRRLVRQPMTVTLRAPIRIGPSLALEYRRLLVPMGRDRESEEAVDLACRLAADRGSTITAITVLEIPMELPLSARPAVGIGFALLVVTAFRGGWVGFVLGALFIAYGAGRFALMRRR